MTAAAHPDGNGMRSAPAGEGAGALSHLRILGPLEVRIAGERATPRGSRERKLLALLALHANTVVTTERIVDTLWDDPPNSARQQIHNVVGGLRRTLTAASDVKLLTDSSGYYRLRAPVETLDALQFRAAVEQAAAAERKGLLDDAVALLDGALDLWRGNALHGLDGAVLTNAATLLDGQRLTALERWAELQLRLGRAALTVDRLKEMLAENPLRESLRALLMTALHRCGRQSEAIAVFEDGRRFLAAELGLDPGAQLLEAHRRILQAEPDAAGEGRNRRAGRPSRPVPGLGDAARSFLPRDITEFTGREEELRRLLDRSYDGNAPSIWVIDGMGGVGKTSLTVHLSHRLAADYPDGQYFVDLVGFSSEAEPMSSLQALSLLLRFDGMAPELIAPDLEGRSAQWRSSVSGRKALILLDNVADVTQVRPLLPGSADCLVLISSRRRMISLEGAASLSLDIMTESDAVALFCRIAGQDRVAEESEAVRSVVEWCGYLPLAIQIAAARLRERTSWRVSFLVDQLRNSTSRTRILAAGDRDVMNIVAWSCHHLTERQHRLLGLLSLHAGPDFDVPATAALADLGVHEVEEDLDKLFELNLLKQHVADRYHMHDIVRDCARRLLDEEAGPSVVADAVRRLADYYIWSACAWGDLFSKPSSRFVPRIERMPESVRVAENAKEAMKLFEIEFRSIVATLRLASGLGLSAWVWQLSRALLPYIGTLNFPEESESLFELGRVAALADESLVGEAACLTGLAAHQRVHGSVAEAVSLTERALELSRAADDRVGQVAQLTNLGLSHWTARDLDRARTCYSEALRTACDMGNVQLQADLTNNLAIISQELGETRKALSYFVQARSLGGQSAVPAAEATVLNNIGFVSVLLGDWEGAAGSYRQSLEVSRAAGVHRGEGLARVGLCIVSRGTGDSPEALRHGRVALDIARSAILFDVEAQALNALGDVHTCDGDLDTAEQVFGQALAAALLQDSVRHVARAREGLAHVASLRGDRDTALTYWADALSTNPGGVVDVAGAERHRAAPEAGGAVCWRCGVADAW